MHGYSFYDKISFTGQVPIVSSNYNTEKVHYNNKIASGHGNYNKLKKVIS